MTTYRDLSGNGKGIEVEPHINTINFAAGDVIIPGKTRYLRSNGAGNITLRPAGGGADIIIAAKDGEYIPVVPGTVVRQTGTSVTGLQGFGGL